MWAAEQKFPMMCSISEWNLCPQFVYRLRILFIIKVFCWTEIHFVGPLVPSVSGDPAYGFQSQGRFMVACTLLWLVHNGPQSHGCWEQALDLAYETSTIPCASPTHQNIVSIKTAGFIIDSWYFKQNSYSVH